MIKIGVVNIDCSHPLAFSRVLMPEDRARYKAVFNEGFRASDEVVSFAKKCGLEKICTSLEELAEYADVGFIQGCDWDRHISQAMPFIEKGKPVFIDKPMVGNLADCRRLLALEKSGAQIMGASSVRYCDEIRRFLTLSKQEKGEVLHADITVGVDEFNYAIHAVEGLCAIMESRPVSVRYVGRGAQSGQTCDTYFVTFANGATGCYHCVLGNFLTFNVIIITTVNTHCFTIDNNKLYKALLDQICNRLEGKTDHLASMEEITDSIKVALAGKYSMENGGEAVSVDSPALENVRFDGAQFTKSYAAAASPIYL